MLFDRLKHKSIRINSISPHTLSQGIQLMSFVSFSFYRAILFLTNFGFGKDQHFFELRYTSNEESRNMTTLMRYMDNEYFISRI